MSMEQLVEIMARLRDPDDGCPWDREQTFETIVPYTIEEAYEVADAIEQGQMSELKHELGDLLFQVVFYAQMASEQQAFDFADVSRAICEKMIRRHPHVFGDARITSAEDQTRAWEAIKAEEREQSATDQAPGQLAGVARGLPAMLRAAKLQRRAAKVGFDWPDVAGVQDKIQEELVELEQEIKRRPVAEARLAEEVGDLLFSCVNLARHLGVDPEAALHRTNRKFERRFGAMESRLRGQGRELADISLSELDQAWSEVKRQERNTQEEGAVS